MTWSPLLSQDIYSYVSVRAENMNLSVWKPDQEETGGIIRRTAVTDVVQTRAHKALRR